MRSLCDRNVACDMGECHEGMCVFPWRGGPVPIPDDPWNQIANGLWQGGSWRKPYREEFDVVLTMHSLAATPEDGIRHKTWYIPDAEMPELDGLKAMTTWVMRHWRKNRRVLVRCHAGLNRSGLVVASTLVEAGMDAMDAIQLIRTRRSPYALSNNHFYDYIKGLWSNNDYEYFMKGH